MSLQAEILSRFDGVKSVRFDTLRGIEVSIVALWEALDDLVADGTLVVSVNARWMHVFRLSARTKAQAA